MKWWKGTIIGLIVGFLLPLANFTGIDFVQIIAFDLLTLPGKISDSLIVGCGAIICIRDIVNLFIFSGIQGGVIGMAIGVFLDFIKRKDKGSKSQKRQNSKK